MMGTSILLVAFLIELALMACSLLTKSHHEKSSSVLHVTVFAVFAALNLTSVIQWSFRWYAMAILLFVWAARGAFRLFKQNGHGTEFRAGRVIFKAISTWLLVFIAITPALIFPQYKLPEATGKYKVGTVQSTFVDESRIEEYSNMGGFRKLNVACWHPENVNHRVPLVLFSHGGLGTKTSNESLYIELASHGYVVCAIGHAHHSFWTKFEDGTVAWLSMDYFKELQREDAKTDKEQSYAYYQKWMNIRTGDINFVMDTLLENRASGGNGVSSLIDTDKIGVIGHSQGGSAALAMPRQRDDVDAVIALESPFLYDIVGVENHKFVWTDQPYPVPLLTVYSDSSWAHLSAWSQYARNHEILFNTSETVSTLYLPGRGHFSMTDLSLASPLLVRLLDGEKPIQNSKEYLKTMNQACLDFFDRYLKGRNG
ncbi:MAG: hypothetical protein KAZ26_10680 [Caldilineaceae bacterium]|nr:hypothetical protein [Caldilineaceae bacterium]